MSEHDSLAGFLDRVRGPQKTVSVYGPTVPAGLRSLLDRFDVDVVHESLPIDAADAYLAVTAGAEFLGSVPATAYANLLDPPGSAPGDPALRESALRDVTTLLAESAFTSAARPQLTATTREFEDRAWRVGSGTLAAGFQTPSVLRNEAAVYRRLADESALAVHAFAAADPDESVEGVGDTVVHTRPERELADFWFVAFDGDGDDEMACALLAEETADGTFRGAWTYDSAVVRALLSYLDEAYGLGEQNG